MAIAGFLLQAACHLVDDLKLLRRLHIEHEDTRFPGHIRSRPLVFPTPENTIFCGSALRMNGPVELASGDHIHSSPQVDEEAKQGQIGTGLVQNNR